MFIDEEKIRGLLRMEELIPAMRDALRDLSAGKVEQPMRLVLPVAELRAIEQRHAHEPLMERAGLAVAEEALRRFPRARTFALHAGKGANGGDGTIAARILEERGWRQVADLLEAKESHTGSLRRLRKGVNPGRK